MLLDQHGAEVVDIGHGRAGHEQIADRAEERPRIVVGEHGLGVDPGFCRARERIGIDQRAGIVLGPVDAVSVSGEGLLRLLEAFRNPVA